MRPTRTIATMDSNGPARHRSSRFTKRRAWTLVAVHLAMVAHYVHWKLAGRTLAPLELNEAVYTAAEGVVTAGFLLLVLLVLVSAIFGRFFCSWGCHIVALQDLCAWALERVGIRPRPLRSRVLAALPFALAAYMFLWPIAYRAVVGIDVELHHRAAGSTWSSFVTDDFTRNLPTWPVALATLSICGFVSVYWLGSRAFCSHVCPYGALFAFVDRGAPGRIVARGDCSDCGACTAVCQSHIRVHLELSRFGTVVDPACLRDLDCVGACPEQRVRFGFTRPPLWRGANELRGIERKWDANGFEELLLLALVALACFSLRGLFDVMPLLLTVMASVLFAVTLFLAQRVLRGRRVRALGRELRGTEGMTGAGRAWVLCSSLALIAITENAGVRVAEIVAGSKLDRAQAASDPKVAAHDAGNALALYRIVERFSFDPPKDLEQRIAFAAGLSTRARSDSADETSVELSAQLAQIERAATSGRLAEALEFARVLAASQPTNAVAHYQHGVLLAANARDLEAVEAFERSVELNADDADARNNLGFLLMRIGRPIEAGEHLRRAAELGPRHAAARFNRGHWLWLQGRTSEALPHLYAASELDLRYRPAVEELLGPALVPSSTR